MKLLYMLLVLTVLFLIGLTITTTKIQAHDWYPSTCCNVRDCFAVPMDQVKITPEGYTLPNGETIPFNEPRYPHKHSGEPSTISPDEYFHVCPYGGMEGFAKGKTLRRVGPSVDRKVCFWAPESGV